MFLLFNVPDAFFRVDEDVDEYDVGLIGKMSFRFLILV